MSWSNIASTSAKESMTVPIIEKQNKKRTAKEIIAFNIDALKSAQSKYKVIENKSKNLNKSEEKDIHDSMQRRHASYDEADNFYTHK